MCSMQPICIHTLQAFCGELHAFSLAATDHVNFHPSLLQIALHRAHPTHGALQSTLNEAVVCQISCGSGLLNFASLLASPFSCCWAAVLVQNFRMPGAKAHVHCFQPCPKVSIAALQLVQAQHGAKLAGACGTASMMSTER